MKKILSLVFLFVLICFISNVMAENVDLVILHTNDIHGRIEESQYAGMGMAKLNTLIQEYRRENKNVLLLDAGDTFHGQIIANLVKGESVARILNLMDYDAMVPGNHDFNYGQERLMELNQITDFPIIAANISKDNQPFLQEYVIKNLTGLKIAIFGLSTPETTYTTHPDNVKGLIFNDPVKIAKKMVEKLKDKADVIIALSHLGISEGSKYTSKKIAKEVDGIDLIVDGHSHDALKEGLEINDTLIVMAGEYDKNLGVVRLSVNNGRVNYKKAALINKNEVADIKADQGVLYLVSKIKNQINAITSQVIGKTAIKLNGERKDVRTKESNLANLVTDAMLATVEADCAITNGGGIRASINIGDITNGEVIEVLPFGNFVVVKEVSGTTIMEMIEHGISSYPATEGKFPQVGGMSYLFNPNRPAGERVLEIKINGKPLSLDKKYRLATNDFIAAGGDGYTMLKECKTLQEAGSLEEVVIDYIKAKGTVTPEIEGRIINIVKNKNAQYNSNYQITKKLTLKLIARYNSETGFDEGGAEIVDYEANSQRVFIANGADKAIDIVNISNISNNNGIEKLKREKQIRIENLNIPSFKADDVTSVAVHPGGLYIAAAVTAAPGTEAGRLVLFNSAAQILKIYTTGSLPDMVTFSPDGNYILVANEGEPNNDYSIDPKGSISIVDLSRGYENSTINNLGFDQLKPEQIDNNVRIKKGNTAAADFEPEYIAITPDSKEAYIVLQENNAVVKLDLVNKKLIHAYALGFKDHSLIGNELDVSNKDDKIKIKNWPVLGMYQPDGIDIYRARNNKYYLLTANEGDARDYDTYSEESRVKDIEDKIALNAKYYQGYTQNELNQLLAKGLFNKENLGRLKIANKDGLNNNNEYEALYSYGGRSFSIWDTTDFSLVYDSGSDFAKISAALLPDYFNCDNDETEYDGRSDDKGTEPEAVVSGKINDQEYAFIGLERLSGIMVYNITDPVKPYFVNFYSSRDFSVELADFNEGDIIQNNDIAPEGLKFIPGDKSPTEKPLLLAAHEVSGTLTVYELSVE